MSQLAVRNAIAEHLESLLPTLLEGWQTVVSGKGQPILDADYPLIRVAALGIGAPELDFGLGQGLRGAQPTLRFEVQGYVSAPTVDDEAEELLGNLVWSESSDQGLYPALLLMALLGIEAGGRTWLWEVGEAVYFDPSDGDRWTRGVTIPISASTTL